MPFAVLAVLGASLVLALIVALWLLVRRWL
jgi:hypothetical protein